MPQAIRNWDHQNDSTERVLKVAKEVSSQYLCPDHQNDSTERVLKAGFLYLHCSYYIDHQNDSTERVLKESPSVHIEVSGSGPSKRLDRASTESRQPGWLNQRRA